MPTDNVKTMVGRGIDQPEAILINEAIDLGRDGGQSAVDQIPGLRSVNRTFFVRSGQGQTFRAHHDLVNSELRQLTPEMIAFGDIPDYVREQYSAFCFAMFEGHQHRFIDRHEDEDVTEYLNRPNKTTLNVTRLVINALSKLYHKPPLREFDKIALPDLPEDAEPIFKTPDHIRSRLDEIWASKLFNRTMLMGDKFTRLLGTVAVRPIYDDKVKGKIRNWVFQSHELRVIPNPEKPWEPLAVVERKQPFGRQPARLMTIWTDRHQVTLDGKTVTLVKHGLGRIPHVFFRDELSFNSFFVEGRGRILCDPNAVLNNDLSDLEEIKQMQGFSVMQAVNLSEDNARVGPREVFKFDVKDNLTPFGIEFRSPNAPLGELRADCEAQIARIFGVNNVPAAAAFGAGIDQRQLSGEAIRASMQPISDDLEERERIFEPYELDLADSMLRVIARHEPEFNYQMPIELPKPAGKDEEGKPLPVMEGDTIEVWTVPEVRRPQFAVKYFGLSLPKSTRDQVIKDEFDISTAVNTPAGIIRRDSPDQFPTHEDAVTQWKKNLAETADAEFAIDAIDDGGASAGLRAAEAAATPLLDHAEGLGLLQPAIG